MNFLTSIKLAFLLMLFATSASAQVYYEMPKMANQSGYRSQISETVTTADFLRAPANGVQRLAFTQGSAFTATVYACETKSPADPATAGTCTSVATLSATNPSLSITTGRAWLIVDVTAAETTGNVSYLTIRSHSTQQFSGGGAGGGGGAVLGESDYAKLQGLTQLLAASSDLAKIYVSNADEGDLPLGNDAYPGTKAFPVASLDKARDIAVQTGRVWILLDSEDVWGAAADCSGANTPWTSCIGSGARTGALTLDGAFDELDANTDSDKIGIRISSTDPTGIKKARISCAVHETSNATTNIFGANSNTGDEGWIVVENIQTDNCHGWDHYNSVVSGGKFIIIGADCSADRSDDIDTGVGDTDDNSGHCIVLKGDTKTISIRGKYTNADDGDADVANDPLAIISDSAPPHASPSFIDMFSSWDMEDTDYATQNGNVLRLHASTQSLFMGSVVMNSGEIASKPASLIEVTSDANSDNQLTANFVRSVIGMIDADSDSTELTKGFDLQFTTANAVANIGLYQTTFANMGQAIWISGTPATSEVNFKIRGSLFDEPIETTGGNASRYYLYINNNHEQVDFDISKTIYDDDEGGNALYEEFFLGAGYDTCADALAGNASVYTNFFDSCSPTYNSGGAGVDGDSFGALLNQGICLSGEECDGGYDDTYSLILPVVIPSFVTGTAKSILTLGGPGGNFGAR